MDTAFGSSAASAKHRVAAWVPPVARVGFAAKGVVYALVGGIAFQAASAPGGAKGSREALASLASKDGGHLLLLLIAIGLLAHVAWRLVQALLDPEHPEGGHKRKAMRLFHAGGAVVYASLAFTAWQLSRGHRSGSGGGDQQEVWISKLLHQPFGTWLVMAAGLGVMVYGVVQLAKAVRGDVNKHVVASDAKTSRAMQLLGRIGTAARGVVLLPIGWFVFQAGQDYQASKAADTGEALQFLGHHGLLAAVGVGLIAYGLHQLGKAFYRRIEQPA